MSCKNDKCGIYKITNVVNQKIYIGGSRAIYNRWTGHKCTLRKSQHRNEHLQRAWSKYGEQNFKFQIILECTAEEINKEETRLIQEHQTLNRNYGYNIDAGGDSHNQSEETKEKIRKSTTGRKHTKESKRKMSEIRKGISFSKEHCDSISRAKTGKGNHNYGKHFSEEHRKKISKAHLGKLASEETRLKLSEAKTGTKASEETRNKISRALLGTIRSEETKSKISKTRKGMRRSEESNKKQSETKRKISLLKEVQLAINIVRNKIKLQI